MTATDTPLVVFAAGSLEAAFTGIADDFARTCHDRIQPHFGPSGLLREEIEWGEAAHVFASANLAHPQAIAAAGHGGPVAMFARNTLCALVRPGLPVTPDTLLEPMLAPDIIVGTSTPRADPSGDYAWAMFDKAETIIPGAAERLKDKALKLTGAPDSTAAPEGHYPYAWVIDSGACDIFLTYRTNAARAAAEKPDLQIVELPPALAVEADYGLIVLNGAPEAAWRFALHVLSPAGQAILAGCGFTPVNLPEGERP
ncbi:MAG: molybdate ABC transporter substrate-binding protein [Dichotomicrobium sp.]